VRGRSRPASWAARRTVPTEAGKKAGKRVMCAPARLGASRACLAVTRPVRGSDACSSAASSQGVPQLRGKSRRPKVMTHESSRARQRRNQRAWHGLSPGLKMVLGCVFEGPSTVHGCGRVTCHKLLSLPSPCIVSVNQRPVSERLGPPPVQKVENWDQWVAALTCRVCATALVKSSISGLERKWPG
jgi:hypothetical protein